MEAANVLAVVEPIVSGVVEPIVSAVVKELGNMIKKEVSLLIGVEKEVKKLHSKFKAIQAVLVKAGRKQLTDETIRDWLGKIKDVAYEVEDILDEWRIDALISQREKDDIGNQRKISDCPRLEFLPDGMGQLNSLRNLGIFDCPELKHFPPLQYLTTLERLVIRNCPLAKEQLEKEKEEDRCNVSHILINIDGEWIQ